MLSNEDLKWMYTKMLLVRESEERAIELSKKGELPTLLGGSGEEAIVVGICKALHPNDYLAPHHRGMSDILARDGVDPKYLFAELYGKPAGLCKGKGGNMHVADFQHGVMGINGIVGAALPVATGAALAQKMQGTEGVVACMFGDGGSNQGTFNESLNLAAIWKLPIVYICKNNQYAMTTPASYGLSVTDLSERAKGYGIPGASIDGNDVLAVYETINEAVERARRGDGPSFVECKTWRWYGHHAGAGDDEQMGWKYRPEGEAGEARKRDPITRFEKHLLDQKVLTEEEAVETKQSIKKQIEDAVVFAKSCPDPKPEDAMVGVFAE